LSSPDEGFVRVIRLFAPTGQHAPEARLPEAARAVRQEQSGHADRIVCFANFKQLHFQRPKNAG
jgi:hypothetical protein